MGRLLVLAVALLLSACASGTPAAVDHAERATVYAAQSWAEAKRAQALRSTATLAPTARATALPTLLPEPTWAPTGTPPPTVTSTPRATATATATSAPVATARVIVPTVVVTVVTIRRDGEPLPDWAVAAVFALMLLCFAGAAWVLFGKYRNGR